MFDPIREEATQIIGEVSAGDRRRAPELAGLVYDNLRRYAQAMVGGGGGRVRPRTLEATALVHEAYLRLVDQSRVDWQGRTHFFAIGAEMIRRVLVDDARRRGALKRGGDRQRVALATDDGESGLGGVESGVDLLALDDAMAKLAALDPRAARIVELKFFGGMREVDIADILGVSARTVQDDWRAARAWLREELGEATDGHS